MAQTNLDGVYDLHHRVTADEIDGQGHVHNLRYLQWTLWAARDHSASGGWDAQATLDQGSGWVVRGHEVTYRAAALMGDESVVRTWVSDLARYASHRKYVIYRTADQSTLAQVMTRWVYVDLNQRRAIAIPDQAVQQIEVITDPVPAPWEAS
ncbi:MAG: acyl-CoA thioesterase [Planctomycetota bacterium]